jgi:hypothetical protein
VVEDIDAGFAWEEEWEDEYVEDAKVALRAFFAERSQEVFYLKQLEVLFEKPFYHWITAKATNQLIAEGWLRAEEVPLGDATRVKLVVHRSHRYYRRQIGQSLEVIREYSRPEIAAGCGEQADVLFFNALASRGFLWAGEDTNEYEGKKWTKSKHDLDFIMERDGIAYGCEVKNTWDYIERGEMRVKLEVCEFLGVVPLFIMRYSPKSYNEEIYKRGGRFIIFEAHIYPFGQQELVKRIREMLGEGKADCPRAIPSGIIDRFMKVHEGSVA